MIEAARQLRDQSTPTRSRPAGIPPSANIGVFASPPVREAFNALRLGFTVAPIVAGADKFFHALVNWDQYLAPVVPRLTGIDAGSFMRGVGGIEILVGIGVALKPRVFGYVVSAWLVGIIGNLLLARSYYDIALRDLGLALGAFAMARLAAVSPSSRTRT